jgi:hypothetical protein
MSLIKELLALKKPIPTQVTEAHVFDDIVTMKFDPDRADIGDVVDQVVPLLARMAYVQFTHDKAKHEKLYDDPEDEKFKFTADECANTVDEFINLLRDKLGEVSTKDIMDALNHGDFKFEKK